jgi:hypothetical protein
MLAAAALLALLPGFVAGAGDQVFTATLTGSAQVPPVTTSGKGTASVVINAAGTQVSYAVSYSGLSGPLAAAHIHVGAAGTNGPVALPLSVGPSPMFGTLTAANFMTSASAPTFASVLTAIRTGKAYVNLHTALHPDGEIRGQLKSTAAAATPTPKATPRVTLPGATGVETGAPGTYTDPILGRESRTDVYVVLAVLTLAIAGGLFATWKVKPGRRRRLDQ